MCRRAEEYDGTTVGVSVYGRTIDAGRFRATVE